MVVSGVNMKTFSHFQTKYTLIDEQDIPLVENYAFEVNYKDRSASFPTVIADTAFLMMPM